MYTHDESQGLLQRATKIIPDGIYGRVTQKLLIPNDAYPLYWEKAQGSQLIDVDDNEYIDYMAAFGPIGLVATGLGSDAGLTSFDDTLAATKSLPVKI